MRALRPWFLAALLLPRAVALAQTDPGAPDEEWGTFPAEGAPASVPPPAVEPPPPAVLPPPPVSLPVGTPTSATLQRPVPRPPRPEDFNRVSMFGAPALGQWNRGLGLHLGFPLVGLRAGLGVLDTLDVGVGFDSFYGAMNEVRALVKWQLAADEHWSLGLAVEGGRAFFSQKPGADPKGARWLTGRRNYNVVPGVLVSYRGDTPRSARMFLDLRYQAAFDTEPYQQDPLGGVPAAVQLGHNTLVRMGAEMPFSPKTSFLFVLGFDLHGRNVDSVFMPACSVGLVTAI